MLSKLPRFTDDNLIVGTETSDDAAVYRINDELALIQTVDFFTPIVDDPYTFGQIAAANSLSDVYAMGGEPKLALNVTGFPNCLDPDVLGEILAGGASKVQEAQAVLVGGHTIQDDEPKYGLCVTGFVHPGRLWKNYGARPGDVLILTKPLGSGILNTAVKAGLASFDETAEVVRVMAELNRTAKRVLERYEVHACTDVTGFGLAGHSMEMAKASKVTMDLYARRVPVMDGTAAYAQMGVIPAGAYQNGDYLLADMDVTAIVKRREEYVQDILLDPQTSGGLLACVREVDAERILKELRNEGLKTKAAVIGTVEEYKECFLRLM